VSDPRLGSRNYQDLAGATDRGHTAILEAIKTVVANRDISRAAQLEYLNRALVGLAEAQAAAKAREEIGREANKEFQRLDKIIEKLKARIAELEGKEPIELKKKAAR
jgi:predicted ribosome quality control (RQC) complex YloA/Tae2 family protein